MKKHMTSSREERLWQKFDEEERHFQYLVKKGYDSITIADQLIHNLLEVMKEGIRTRNPGISDRELLTKVRHLIDADKELRKKSRGMRDGRD